MTDSIQQNGTCRVHNPHDPELEALLAQYDARQAEFDRAEEHLNEIKAKLKAKITTEHVQADGAPHAKYLITSPSLAHPIKLAWRTWKAFNTKRFREIYPQMAEEFTEVKGTWRMERSK